MKDQLSIANRIGARAAEKVCPLFPSPEQVIDTAAFRMRGFDADATPSAPYPVLRSEDRGRSLSEGGE